MFSLLLSVEESDQDLVTAELLEAGTTGIVEHGGGTLEAFFDATVDRNPLLQQFAAFTPEIADADATDWVRRTEESFPPRLIGQKFFLVPPWNRDPAPAGRMRLEINPGMACGTGWHPCTRLCIEALERCLRPGDRVLDVGVGSGILSAAATLLGAGVVIGCDIDPEAVRIAHANVPVFNGSVDALAPGAFDVLVANISAEAACELFLEFRRIARVLILSGFQAAPPLPEPVTAMIESEGWLCLVIDNRSV